VSNSRCWIGRWADPKRGLKCTSQKTFEDLELEASGRLLKPGSSKNRSSKEVLTFL